MTSHFHQYGGRDLARHEHSWPGLRFDHVRWQAEDGTTGVTRRAEHQVFITLSGSTGRTQAWLDGGPRYDGVDFPGAATFIPASYQRRANYRGGTIEYVGLRLDPGLLEHFDRPSLDQVAFRGFTNRPDPLLHRLALALSEEARSAGAVSRLFVESVATTVMLQLLRTGSNLRTGPAVPAPLGGAALHRVVEYVDAHLAEDLGLVVLAGVSGTDRSRFSRGFKAATGTSPHQFVIQRRLERAARLLRAADGPPIGEIAYQVGLSSQSHLTTLFKRSFGTTPAAYRQAQRG